MKSTVWYGSRNPKNLHGRVLEDRGSTVVFVNQDGKPETANVLERLPTNIVVLAASGDFLRLWLYRKAGQ